MPLCCSPVKRRPANVISCVYVGPGLDQQPRYGQDTLDNFRVGLLPFVEEWPPAGDHVQRRLPREIDSSGVGSDSTSFRTSSVRPSILAVKTSGLAPRASNRSTTSFRFDRAAEANKSVPRCPASSFCSVASSNSSRIVTCSLAAWKSQPFLS